MSTPSLPSAPPKRAWLSFLLGGLLFLLGPILYVVQFQRNTLGTPWYVPLLATLGVFLMLLSLFQSRSVWRAVGLILFLAVWGFEWFMLLVGVRTPAYEGPAGPGAQIPTFTTMRADGSAFTQKDLEQGTATLLLFFRGRW